MVADSHGSPVETSHLSEEGSKNVYHGSIDEPDIHDKSNDGGVETVDPASSEGSVASKLFTNEFDQVYLAKSKIVSDAIDELGFGKFQWLLFVVAGWGWMADNMWPIVTSLILPQIILEFLPADSNRGPLITLCQNLGLLFGAALFSFSSDIIGRRVGFNVSFLITGLFGLIAGSSPGFALLGIWTCFYGIGCGANLPIDSALFIEFLPSTHQYVLTIECVWWAIGQLLTNGIAYGFYKNPKWACSQEQAGNCKKEDNWGWRYIYFTMGSISLLCFAGRFLFFKMYESPKFYVARGKDELAVHVVHEVAKRNGKTSSLTIEHLQAVEREYGVEDQPVEQSAKTIIKSKLSQFDMSHIREVFGTKKLAFSSSIMILVWAIIGIAFPLYNAFLPYLLATHGNANEPVSTQTTYRNALIIASLGVPAALLAGVLVELKTGRRGALASSTLLTGVMLFGSTTAKTSNQYLGWNCGFSFASNVMYGVLYAYSAEVFPSRIRGTGLALCSSANRLLGVFSPVIGMLGDLTTPVPVYVSGAMFLAAGVLVVILPYEPRGRASL